MECPVFSSDDGIGRKLSSVVGSNRGRGTGERQSGSESEGSGNPCSPQEQRPQQSIPESPHGATVSSERSPLIRPRRPGEITDGDSDVSSVNNNLPPKRYGAVPKRQPTQPKTGILKSIGETLSMRSSSVMTFLLILVLGIVLAAVANLKTDRNGIQVAPQHVLVYIMCLMVVFILWVNFFIIPQKVQYSSPQRGALIPSHLLTGIGIFGTACAVCHIIKFIDFLKCSRHVKNLNPVFGMYPFFKAGFVYFQIYFFYKLSRDGIRNCRLPGGNFFVMFTLATNMCIWWSVFLGDASNNPKMQNATWLTHYHYGIDGPDPCANASITSPQVKQLHDFVSDFQPYFTTFSLEYALLASGLLLHIWQSLKTSHSSQSGEPLDQQNWTLWRVGFIAGLLSIPTVVVANIHAKYTNKVSTGVVILYFLQGCICSVLLLTSIYCISLMNKYFTKRNEPIKLEVILLGVSFVGFPILDLCYTFAAISETGNLPASELVWLGLSSVAELVAYGLQFLFVKKSYEFKLPEVASNRVRIAAQRIRQFASFALVVNIAYWGAKTYELRRGSGNVTAAEKFFGKYTWFCLSHLAFPLCIFFHFHLAICFANVVFFYSQFGPLYQSGFLD